MTRLPDRGYMFLLIAVVTSITAVIAFVVPERLPEETEFLIEMTSSRSLTRTTWVVTALLLFIIAGRIMRGENVVLDRSTITADPPEVVSNRAVREPAESLSSVYTAVHGPFESPGKIQRRVAMYGRRAGEHDDLPEAYSEFFDEIAITARDTYATSTTMSIDAAEEAIENGTWTDDRIAAAFLASDVDAEPTFTLFERVIAWIDPQQTFENRLDRTIAEIEKYAESYLTYTDQQEEMQRYTRAGEEKGNT